jgi:hypothetical protein
MAASRSRCVVHGSLTGDGGAQRVAIELARTFDCPLFALQIDESHVPEDVDARELLDGAGARWWLTQGRRRDVQRSTETYSPRNSKRSDTYDRHFTPR